MNWLIIAIVIAGWLIANAIKSKEKNENLLAGNIARDKWISARYSWMNFLENQENKKRNDLIELLSDKSLTDKQKWDRIPSIIKKYEAEYARKSEEYTKLQSDLSVEIRNRGAIDPNFEDRDYNEMSYRKEDWWLEEQKELDSLLNPLLIKFDPETAEFKGLTKKHNKKKSTFNS
jgi:hypothetical protein